MNPVTNRMLCIVFALFPVWSAAADLELTAQQMANLKLSTTVVNARDSQARLNLTGTLRADRRKTHAVAPIVEGMVTELKVIEHERVRKGQILARLRSSTLGQTQADYLEALARNELAQTERNRIESLWKEGVVAESRWLQVDSEHKRARATLEARRRLLTLAGLSAEQITALAKEPARLAEFTLISPIDGVVVNVEIETGQLLTAGQPAFHVDDHSTLWAVVKIPVASLAQAKVGAEAIVTIQASPDQPYRGQLESLGGEVDADSQTLAGHIVVQNRDGLLRPGMHAQVALSGLATQGLMVPANAVFRMGDQAYVFKVAGPRRYQAVVVTTGPARDGWIQLQGGLAAGSEIVSEGVAELKSHLQYQGG